MTLLTIFNSGIYTFILVWFLVKGLFWYSGDLAPIFSRSKAVKHRWNSTFRHCNKIFWIFNPSNSSECNTSKLLPLLKSFSWRNISVSTCAERQIQWRTSGSLIRWIHPPLKKGWIKLTFTVKWRSKQCGRSVCQKVRISWILELSYISRRYFCKWR